MSDQLRERLHEEMALETRPSLDGLVQQVVARGAGVRRRRRIASGAGTTVVVAAVAAVVALGGVVTPEHSGSASSKVGSTPSTAVTPAHVVAKATAAAKVAPPQSVAAAVPTSADGPAAVPAAPITASRDAELQSLKAKLLRDLKSGSSDIITDKQRLEQLVSVDARPVTAAAALPPGVPATPAGMLELLTSQLPAGSTSHAGVSDDGTRGVEVYVKTPNGPAMVRVFLDRSLYVPAGCGDQTGCTVEPNGDIVVVHGLPDNCIQTQFVSVTHPDGSNVSINLSTCLEWDGTQNAPSPLAMTVDQATALAMDPRWDVSMDPALVTAGAAHFPSPHQFG